MEPLIAVVMSEKAALALSAACQLGKFRIEDWLEDPLDVGRDAALRERSERAREWLDWGQRWLIDGRRLQVAENEALKAAAAALAEALEEARAFLDTRYTSRGALARPANLIERIDALLAIYPKAEEESHGQ